MQKLPLSDLIINFTKQTDIKITMYGNNAYTDGKVINLPNLDLSKDENYKTIFAYLSHEAGHILYSDFLVIEQVYKKGEIFFYLFNFMEDMRIEYKVSRAFCHTTKAFCSLARDIIFTKNCQWVNQVNKRNFLMNLISFLYLYMLVRYYYQFDYRFILYKLKGKLSKLFVNKDHLRSLFIIFKGAIFSKNTQEVANLTADFVNILQLNVNFNSKQKRFSKLENYFSNASCDNEKEYKDNLKKIFNTPWLVHNFEYQDIMLKMQNPLAKYLFNISDKQIYIKDELGEMSYDPKETNQEYSQSYLIKSNNIGMLKRALINTCYSYQSAFVQSSRYGYRINKRKLVYINTAASDIFLKQKDVKAFNTNLTILVDVSGSMIQSNTQSYTRAQYACSCAYEISKCLDKFNIIKNQVLFFPGTQGIIYEAKSFKDKAYNCMGNFCQYPRGSTPLAQALFLIGSKLKSNNAKRNIVIVITDGVPDSIKQSQSAIRSLEQRAVEVYALGINIKNDLNLFKNYVQVDDIDNLDKYVFETVGSCFEIGKI